MAKLGKLRHLRRLEFDGAPLDDAARETIASLPAVRRVALRSCAIHGPGLPALLACPTLRWLDLSNAPLRAEAPSPAANESSL